MLRGLLIVVSLAVLGIPASAKPPAAAAATTTVTTRPAAELLLKTDRVVLFKDGHGLVVQSGSATADAEGRAYITDVPDSAVLGCFWATTGGGGGDAGERIVAMRAEWDEKKETRDQKTSCITMAELLRANAGKTVTLELTDKLDKGEAVTISGKIVDLLDVPADPEHPWMQPAAWRRAPGGETSPPPPPITYTSFIQRGVLQSGSFTPESFIGEGTLARDLVPGGGDFVVISEDDNRRLVLPVDHVQSIRGGADVVTTTNHQQEVFTRSKRLSFDFGKESSGKNVSLKLFYFTPGLRWIPTYRISGELKEKADLALQGEILNEVTDIDHAAVDLVVGVPNFRFDDTVSPLTLEQTMRGALVAANINVGNNLMSQQFSNGDFRGRAGTPPATPADAGMTAAPELNGSGAEQDLFVYNVQDFSLRKGARATVPLWQQQADLRHLYTFDVNTHRSRASGQLMDDAANPNEQQQPPDPRRHRGPNRIVFNQVWHQLELTNTSKVPWTTGAALMLRNTLPIGQDLLTYTPPTGKSLVPVTVAVDIRGTVDEQQTARQENALHFDGSDYIKITKKGTITLTSYRSEKSNTRVTLSTGGHVTTASDNGAIKYNDFRAGDWDDSGYLRPNEHSDVSWDFSLDPGATKTITYELTFYTR